jgi:hypothetical protein
MDVFDKRVVYYAGGQMWRVGYTTDQRTGDVKLSDEPPEKVRRVTTYKLVKNDERNIGTMDYSYGPFKEPDMNRTALISFLTTNCDCWRGQEETLNKMTDDQLNKLKVGHDRLVQAETVANAARQGFEHGDNGYTYNTATGAWEAKPKPKPPAPPVIPVAQPVPQPAPQNVPVAQPVANTLTEAEWLQTAPPGIRRAVQNSMSIEAREKSQLVERLTANVTDPEVKKKHVERLMLKDVPELTDLVSLLPEPVQNYYTPVQPGQTSYAGAQGAVVNAFSKEEKEEVLPLPIMNYEDETEEVA